MKTVLITTKDWNGKYHTVERMFFTNDHLNKYLNVILSSCTRLVGYEIV